MIYKFPKIDEQKIAHPWSTAKHKATWKKFYQEFRKESETKPSSDEYTVISSCVVILWLCFVGILTFKIVKNLVLRLTKISVFDMINAIGILSIVGLVVKVFFENHAVCIGILVVMYLFFIEQALNADEETKTKYRSWFGNLGFKIAEEIVRRPVTPSEDHKALDAIDHERQVQNKYNRDWQDELLERQRKIQEREESLAEVRQERTVHPDDQHEWMQLRERYGGDYIMNLSSLRSEQEKLRKIRAEIHRRNKVHMDVREPRQDLRKCQSEIGRIERNMAMIRRSTQ